MQPSPSHTSIISSDEQSYSEGTPQDFWQSMETQTPYQPRIRLKKVIFRKDILERRPPDQTEVNVEDYQITKDGKIVDGACGKIVKQKNDRVKRGLRDNSFHTDGEVARRTDGKLDDSYDCFGKYVASLLRAMQPQQAFELQAEIVNLIVESQPKLM